MIKLVIVEDEEIIRDGIKDSIRWEELGIEVVGSAEDGEQALSLIGRFHPDIVITDIRIPFVDGLQLAELVAEDSPGTSFVIISGYDDFGYAQRALKLGVEDYILKPINLDYLEEILRDICLKRGRLASEITEIRELRELATRSSRVARKRSLLDLAYGRLTEAETEKAFPDFRVAPSCFAFACVVLDARRSDPPDRPDIAAACREAGRRLFESLDDPDDQGLFFMEDGDLEFAMVAVGRGLEPTRQALANALPKVREALRAFPSVSATIGVGTAREGIGGLALSRAEARKAEALRFILGSNRTIEFAKVEKLTANGIPGRIFYESELVWAVKLGDRSGIRANLDHLLRETSLAGERAAQHLQMHVASIFMSCMEAILEEGGTVEELYEDPIAVYNSILARPTAGEVLELLGTALEAVAAYLETDRKGGKSHLPEKAKRYIRRHYGRYDLGLDEVAEYLRLSPSYFSSVFSKYEGLSFVDYLSRVRLEKAKDLLLRSAYRTSEVADMVGFASPAYFSSIFRRYENCSPSEFRKRNLEGSVQ